MSWIDMLVGEVSNSFDPRKTALIFAFALAGCGHGIMPENSTLLEPATLFPAAVDPLTGTTQHGAANSPSIPSRLDQFVQAANTAYTSRTTASIKTYVSKGVSLSDDQCYEWLTALSHQNTEISLGTGWFNIVSNTVVSALGLSGASAGAISGVGIGSAAVNAATQDYRSAILFTPDFATLHQKIDDARKPARDLLVTNTYTDFDQATRDLVTYDKMCSRDSVQLLLQQSLANSTYQIPNLASPPASAAGAPKLLQNQPAPSVTKGGP